MASATQRQYESMFQQNPVGPEDTQQQQQQQQAAAQTAEVAQAAQQPQHGMGAVSIEPEAVVDHAEPTVSHSGGDALPTSPASSLGADVAGTAASAPHVDTRLDHKRQQTAPESQSQVESLLSMAVDRATDQDDGEVDVVDEPPDDDDMSDDDGDSSDGDTRPL